MNDFFDLLGVEKVSKPKYSKNRNLGFDMIYTDSSNVGLCCHAIQLGLKYGIQSKSLKSKYCCKMDEFSGRHKVVFVDNDYKKYNHQTHLETVKRFNPKYATVRDLMTPEQCELDKIEYFSFDKIMEFAYELKEYAENVIIIPKYDCINDIPNDFVLGYSVPSSHGGTPLSIDKFKNHKVHLLGGSWKKQLECIQEYDFIVSADNNNVSKIGLYGSFVYPDGSTGKLKENVGISPPNAMGIATTLSLASIAQKLNELFGEQK